MTVYYNEIEPYAAQWLRNLIEAGHIAAGVVDERSIEDVTPGDLRGFKQCHFFAGIGVWSYALRQSGWSDDRPVWTGSCPCQPFSDAGKGAGFDDERHLWPHFHYLIEKLRPQTVFGEQVASKDGLAWFDLVQTDLEGTGYAAAALDICAAGFGAPHIRQRLFWVANSDSEQRNRSRYERASGWNEPSIGSSASGLADAASVRCEYEAKQGLTKQHSTGGAKSAGISGAGVLRSTPAVNGIWRDADWLLCRDGKWRPVEPGSFPLANGATQRVGRLRAYGNAINAEVAKGFIEAFMEVQHA